MIKRFFYILLAVAFVGLPLTQASAHAIPGEPPGFRASFLIDDSQFQASNTMDGEGVNAFLASKGGWLANYVIPEYVNVPYFCRDGGTNQTQYVQARQWHVSNFPLYGMRVSDLIAERSRATGINPQVILTLIERESSGITRAAPTSEFTQAWPMFYNFDEKMATYGYGCAEARAIAQDYGGVGLQLAYGAFNLRNKFNQANDWNSPITIDGVTFTPETRATKVFYIYTPHIHNGNHNFWFLFNKWFNSFPPNPYVPTLRKDVDETVYLLEEGGKWPVTGAGFSAWNFSWSDVGVMTDAERALPTRNRITQLPRTADGTVYYMDKGKKRIMTSARVFERWNFNWGDVSEVTYNLLDKISTGFPMHELTLSTNGDGTVFLATENTLYPISGDIFNNAWRFSFSDVGKVPGYVTQTAYQGPVMGRLVVPAGGDGTLFLIDRGLGYRVSGPVAASWKLDMSKVMRVNAALLDERGNGGMLTNLIKLENGDGTIYLVSGGKKQPITGATWRSRGYSVSEVRTVSAGLLNSLPTGDTVR